jgi:hypothetical protein
VALQPLAPYARRNAPQVAHDSTRVKIADKAQSRDLFPDLAPRIAPRVVLAEDQSPFEDVRSIRAATEFTGAC